MLLSVSATHLRNRGLPVSHINYCCTIYHEHVCTRNLSEKCKWKEPKPSDGIRNGFDIKSKPNWINSNPSSEWNCRVDISTHINTAQIHSMVHDDALEFWPHKKRELCWVRHKHEWCSNAVPASLGIMPLLLPLVITMMPYRLQSLPHYPLHHHQRRLINVFAKRKLIINIYRLDQLVHIVPNNSV